jgi:hypothetical protein
MGKILNGVQGVPSSNLGAPTSFSPLIAEALWPRLWPTCFLASS